MLTREGRNCGWVSVAREAPQVPVDITISNFFPLLPLNVNPSPPTPWHTSPESCVPFPLPVLDTTPEPRARFSGGLAVLVSSGDSDLKTERERGRVSVSNRDGRRTK